MVVNIDGFNEVALSNLNNKNQVDLAMPSIQHIWPLANFANNSLPTKAMEATLRIQENKTRINQGLSSLQNCSFKSVLQDSLAFEEMAWNWAKSSIFMHKVLCASNV
jgi:hypothetical protein